MTPPVEAHRPRAAESAHQLRHTPRGILRDDVQHRLDIRRRTGDDAQDFTRRRLLLQATPCSSWNSRTFSIAITAWSAKVSSSLICAGVKGRTSMRRAMQCIPTSSLSLTKRNGQERYASATAEPDSGNRLCACEIGNMKRAMLAHPANCWFINTDLDAASGYGAEMSPRNQ